MICTQIYQNIYLFEYCLLIQTANSNYRPHSLICIQILSVLRSELQPAKPSQRIIYCPSSSVSFSSQQNQARNNPSIVAYHSCNYLCGSIIVHNKSCQSCVASFSSPNQVCVLSSVHISKLLFALQPFLIAIETAPIILSGPFLILMIYN